MNGIIDSTIDYFKSSYDDAVTKWQAALAALDDAYNEFVGNRDFAQSDAQLSAQYADLDSKVSFLQSTIQNVGNAITSMEGFFSGLGQSIGLSSAQTMQGMGLLPAVPWALVALVTAGIAGVWAIVNQLRTFNVDVTNRKIAAQNIVNSQNGQPLIPYVDTSSGGDGLFSGISGVVKLGVLATVAFMLFNSVPKNHHD